MRPVSGEKFRKRFLAEFNTSRDRAAATETQRDWSAYMFPLLASVAKSLGLWWAGSGFGLPSHPDPAEGERREYLWDFTMYARASRAKWNLPQVVVEHENLHSFEAFQLDHWKTLLANAPLRVAIGYTPRERDRDMWVKSINTVARQPIHGWNQHRTGQDLIALGYWGMTDKDARAPFRFWIRHADEQQWTEFD